MANICFNISKAKLAYYAGLPATNDALIVVPIEASGLVSDATMADYDTLTALLAGASNEQGTMGRKTAASVVVTVDDSNDQVTIDMADLTWTGASGNATGALVICYDPDTTTGTDADLVPLTKHDFAYTPSGGDIVIEVNVFAVAT